MQTPESDMHAAFASSHSCGGRPVLTGKSAAAHSVPHSPSSAAQQAAQSISINKITGVTGILDEFQGVLLDQFGVLHDGKHPYPHAVAAVQRLHDAGKQIIVLSNSSRRSGGTIEKLVKLGFKAKWFAGAITSGELTHQYLRTRPTLWWQRLGHRCMHFTWSSRGAVSLDDLDLQVVVGPQDADFILAHGTEASGLPDGSSREMTSQGMQQLLQQCAQQQEMQGRQLPMVVANPDLVTVDGESLKVMPGTLARYYKQLGGQVQLMGKPDPIIYTAAMQLLPNDAADPQKWLAIGDSLEHDIAGATQAGMKTLFVVGGIHASDVALHGSPAEGCRCTWDESALQQLCRRHKLQPDFCMAYLQQ